MTIHDTYYPEDHITARHWLLSQSYEDLGWTANRSEMVDEYFLKEEMKDEENDGEKGSMHYYTLWLFCLVLSPFGQLRASS